MKRYKALIKDVFSGPIAALSKKRGLTQEEMAEQLRITSRAYGDLERGTYCLSAVTLLFFLLMLEDEERKGLLEEFRKRVLALEQKEAA